MKRFMRIVVVFALLAVSAGVGLAADQEVIGAEPLFPFPFTLRCSTSIARSTASRSTIRL